MRGKVADPHTAAQPKRNKSQVGAPRRAASLHAGLTRGYHGRGRPAFPGRTRAVMLLPLRRNLLLTVVLAWATGVVARLGLLAGHRAGPGGRPTGCAPASALAALMVLGPPRHRRARAGPVRGNLRRGSMEVAMRPRGAGGRRRARAGGAGRLGCCATLPRELPRNPVRQTLRFALRSRCARAARWARSPGDGLLANAADAEPLFAWVAGWLGEVTGIAGAHAGPAAAVPRAAARRPPDECSRSP